MSRQIGSSANDSACFGNASNSSCRLICSLNSRTSSFFCFNLPDMAACSIRCACRSASTVSEYCLSFASSSHWWRFSLSSSILSASVCLCLSSSLCCCSVSPSFLSASSRCFFKSFLLLTFTVAMIAKASCFWLKYALYISLSCETIALFSAPISLWSAK